MLIYKIDVLKKLKEKGYSSARIRKEGLLAEATMQNIRAGKVVGAIALNTICELLQLQPGSIIGYIADPAQDQQQSPAPPAESRTAGAEGM